MSNGPKLRDTHHLSLSVWKAFSFSISLPFSSAHSWLCTHSFYLSFPLPLSSCLTFSLLPSSFPLYLSFLHSFINSSNYLLENLTISESDLKLNRKVLENKRGTCVVFQQYPPSLNPATAMMGNWLQFTVTRREKAPWAM